MKKVAKSFTLKSILSGPFYKRNPRRDWPLQRPGNGPSDTIECLCLDTARSVSFIVMGQEEI